MKGTILNFDLSIKSGLIAGDDGERYSFSLDQWKSAGQPGIGGRVDFVNGNDSATDVYRDVASSSGGSKKIAAALLALFLGVFGIHKFYLGYKTQGLIMLLVFVLGFVLFGVPSLIVSIIAFVEFIIYILKSDEEFEQVYVVGRKPWF